MIHKLTSKDWAYWFDLLAAYHSQQPDFSMTAFLKKPK